MIRVLHITRRYWPFVGGVETFVKNLAERQVKAGKLVSVLTLRDFSSKKSEQRSLTGDEIKNGVTIYRLRSFGLRNYRFAPHLLDYFRFADVVHVHNVDYLSEYIGLLKKRHKRPLILSTHGGFFHNQTFKTMRHMRLKLFTAVSLRCYDYILCTSEEDCRIFGPYCSKYTRFPNAIKLPHAQKLDRLHDEETIIFIGRLQKHKQVDLLIRCLELVIHKYGGDNIKCFVIGSDWGEKTNLQHLISLYGLTENVFLCGEVNDIEFEKFQLKCGLFVSPSAFESFGIGVIESMAWGNLVMVNDIPAHREFIRNGENGWLTDFSNVEGSAELLLKILRLSVSEKSRIRNNARISSERYSWDNRYNELEKVYNYVMSSLKKKA